MKLNPSPSRRLTTLEQMAESPMVANTGGPVLAAPRYVRLARTVAPSGGSYPADPAKAYPIVFLDGNFSPIGATAVATFTPRTTDSEAWAYSLAGYVHENSLVVVMYDNGLATAGVGEWFIISNTCFVDKVEQLNDSGHTWGIYYHKACEDANTWHKVIDLGLGDCPTSCSGSSSSSGGGTGCSEDGYSPGSGWTSGGPSGAFAASFFNDTATTPPADPPSGSWIFIGNAPLFYQWYAPNCNWVAYGDSTGL